MQMKLQAFPDGKHMSHVTRKPVLGVCDQLRLQPACSVDVTNYGLEISAIASRGIILYRQRTTKALSRLHGCAGWSAPLLFAYVINRFSHGEAHIIEFHPQYFNNPETVTSTVESEHDKINTSICLLSEFYYHSAMSNQFLPVRIKWILF